MNRRPSSNHTSPARLVAGIEGEVLTAQEFALFSDRMPAGFILFARNCRHGNALEELTASLCALDPHRDIPIFIDQEGGRVVRIKQPITPTLPALGKIGEIARCDRDRARELAYLHGRATAYELCRFGITVDCVPCLDVAQADVTWAIGDRSFGGDPSIVAELGEELRSGLTDGGVLPVIKHLPGHGRAIVDSHLALPTVETGLSDLRACDFVPFAALRDVPFGMTAHIVYQAIDPTLPATLSRVVIEDIIRAEIGFDGILLSDDLSMAALGGSIAGRAQASLAAGCDLALHCNGRIDELRALMDTLPVMSDNLEGKLEKTMQTRQKPSEFDIEYAHLELLGLA